MSIAGELINGLGLWITRRERQEDRDDAAVRSVLSALNTTRRYLARRQGGEPEDLAAEANLVELWTSAAVHIRRTDLELAMRLQDKATYWTNPNNWAPDEVVSNGIQVTEIAERAKRLLGTV